MHSISTPAISSRLGSSASLSQLLRPRGNTFVPQHRAAFRRGISPCTLLQASPSPDSTSHTPPRRQSPAHTAFLTSDGLLLRPANQFAHRSASPNGQPNGLTLWVFPRCTALIGEGADASHGIGGVRREGSPCLQNREILRVLPAYTLLLFHGCWKRWCLQRGSADIVFAELVQGAWRLRLGVHTQ